MELRWTANKTRTRHGALAFETNQEKRVEWCKEQIKTGDMDFDNVAFSEECMVQLGMSQKDNVLQ